MTPSGNPAVQQCPCGWPIIYLRGEKPREDGLCAQCAANIPPPKDKAKK